MSLGQMPAFKIGQLLLLTFKGQMRVCSKKGAWELGEGITAVSCCLKSLSMGKATLDIVEIPLTLLK